MFGGLVGFGGVCWFCHWGWPKQIVDIRLQAEKELDELEDDQRGYATHPLEFGPGHVVWSDENFDDAIVKSCIKDCDNPPSYMDGFSKHELAIVKKSLEALLQVPAEMRTPPQGYDGKNPEKYPPPPEWNVTKATFRW